MHITVQKAGLLALAFLGTAANAFKAVYYENDDCTGDSYVHNVWDYSCSYLPSTARSFIPTHYGGNDQVVNLFTNRWCAGPTTFTTLKVAERDPAEGFKVGECFDTKGTVNAVNSNGDPASYW